MTRDEFRREMSARAAEALRSQGYAVREAKPDITAPVRRALQEGRAVTTDQVRALLVEIDALRGDLARERAGNDAWLSVAYETARAEIRGEASD